MLGWKKSAGAYQLSDKVVFNLISNELVVVELKSGRFFHFSPVAKEFFEAFRAAQKIPSENRNLDAFCRFLAKKKIFKLVSSKLKSPVFQSDLFETPAFIREGEIKLEDVNFYY